MKTGLLVIVGLLSCCCMYSQQKAPPTEEELQAMIKKIQKQSDSIQRILKEKTGTTTRSSKQNPTPRNETKKRVRQGQVVIKTLKN